MKLITIVKREIKDWLDRVIAIVPDKILSNKAQFLSNVSFYKWNFLVDDQEDPISEDAMTSTCW
jgi:hypothetical protein